MSSALSSIPRFPATAADHLSRHGWAVVPQFYPEWRALQQDVLDLRSSGHFRVAKIGQDGLVQDEATPFRDIRYSESCMLSVPKILRQENDGEESKLHDADTHPSHFFPQDPKLPENEMRRHLLHTVQILKHDLQNAAMEAQAQTSSNTERLSSVTTQSNNSLSSLQMPLDEQLHEIMYLYYPSGGYYKRHVDAEPSSPSSWRQYSFLLYMNDDNEQTEVGPTGGQLRLYRDSGDDELPNGELPNFVNIEPSGGTLVVFVSDMVPHEVLATTTPQRCAVVGWFLSSMQSQSSVKPSLSAARSPLRVCDTLRTIAPDTLQALRALRDAVPMMKDKLEPKQTDPDPTSGLIQPASILDDWGIVMPSATETSHSTPSNQNTVASPPTLFPDTDPRYWKSIVTFDEDGRIVTAGWGGLRLRRLTDMAPMLETALWQDDSLTTVDLANTYLPLPTLTQLLQLIHKRCATSWCQCYLGSNGLGQDSTSFVQLIPYLTSLQVLDLRYNDFGDNESVLKTLLKSCSRLEKLYLEGNRLGDTGVLALLESVKNSDCACCHLRELYLGQNDIGPEGASTLAQALVNDGPLSACEKLYLEGNCIGPSGAQTFRQVLLEHKDTIRLQKLYVDNNQIGKQDSIALGAALNSATVIGDSAFSQ